MLSKFYPPWSCFTPYDSRGDFTKRAGNSSIKVFIYSKYVIFITMYVLEIQNIICSLFGVSNWEEGIL